MSAQRFSLYRHIHKAIRAVAHDMVEHAQRTDFSEPREVETLARVVEEAFAIFEGHAAKETEFLTPVLRVCAPSLAADSDGEHREQELRMRDLRRALQAAGRAQGTSPALGHAFVVGLSRFEGEMLVHMADEEERLMPALWSAFDDAALERIHQALLASIPPADKARVVGWLLPALSAPERTELLGSLRASVPPQAFETLRGLAQRVLSSADWERLDAELAAAA
jgi:hypothetical protein